MEEEKNIFFFTVVTPFGRICGGPHTQHIAYMANNNMCCDGNGNVDVFAVHLRLVTVDSYRNENNLFMP